MRCDLKRCQAECCYNVPIPKKMLSAYRKKIVNPVIRVVDAGRSGKVEKMDFVIPQTDEEITKNKCPFLRKDCRCNIYPNRPYLCRIFGDETNKGDEKELKCEYRIP